MKQELDLNHPTRWLDLTQPISVLPGQTYVVSIWSIRILQLCSVNISLQKVIFPGPGDNPDDDPVWFQMDILSVHADVPLNTWLQSTATVTVPETWPAELDFNARLSCGRDVENHNDHQEMAVDGIDFRLLSDVELPTTPSSTTSAPTVGCVI